MESIKQLINKQKILVLIGFVFLMIVFLGYKFTIEKDNVQEDITIVEKTTTTKKIIEKQFIDIKGSVNNPGVYEFKENDRVIDAIEMAGGLTSDANTSNINLSQKLTSEMVIYVYNNKEINDSTPKLTCDTVCKREVIEVNNCIDKPDIKTNDNNSEKINLNTASLDELKTISGIGESKAKNIIEYRSNNGKFNSIEDIKNISGIGDALFEKIKDKITV